MQQVLTHFQPSSISWDSLVGGPPLKTVNILNLNVNLTSPSKSLFLKGYFKGCAFEVDELSISNWANAVETVCRATCHFFCLFFNVQASCK